MSEEKWISLNGCNACINSVLCKELGNCVLLSINEQFLENNKRKRKLIQKIRSMPNENRLIQAEELIRKFLVIKKEKLDIVQEPVRLTNLEKMFIASLNKKR